MAGKSADTEHDFILFASKASHLLANDKVDKAVKVCEEGVREFPFYAPGHYILGLCYDSLGKNEDAKHEYERVLIFDPSHNTAMRKLAEIYSKKGLVQVSNELLIKEALYSPLNPEIISILKEQNLYDSLCPIKEIEVLQEAPLEEEIDPTEEPYIEIPEEDSEVFEDVTADTEYTDSSRRQTETQEIKEETIYHEEVDVTGFKKDDALEEEVLSGRDDDAFSNLDPLAESEVREDSDFDGGLSDEDVSDIVSGSTSGKDRPTRELKKADEAVSPDTGYLDIDDDEMDENEWLEVENLLIDERYEEKDATELDTYSSVLPQSEMLRNDTELLLEELKSADFDTEVSDNTDLGVDEIDNIQGEAYDVEEDPDEYIETSSVEESSDAESYDLEEGEVTIKDMMENPNLVTPTFGEILIAQHKFSEARHVFLELKKREPENKRFEKKITFLNKFLEAQNLP